MKRAFLLASTAAGISLGGCRPAPPVTWQMVQFIHVKARCIDRGEVFSWRQNKQVYDQGNYVLGVEAELMREQDYHFDCYGVYEKGIKLHRSTGRQSGRYLNLTYLPTDTTCRFVILHKSADFLVLSYQPAILWVYRRQGSSDSIPTGTLNEYVRASAAEFGKEITYCR